MMPFWGTRSCNTRKLWNPPRKRLDFAAKPPVERNPSTAHIRQRTRLRKACHDDHETRHRRHRTHHFACELHHLCQIRRITTQSCCYRRSNRHQPVFATAAERRRLRRSSLRSMTPVSSQHFRHRARQGTVFLQPQPPGIQNPARRRISHAGSHQT